MDDGLKETILNSILETIDNKDWLTIASEEFNERQMDPFDIFDNLSNKDFQNHLTKELKAREIDYFPVDQDGFLEVINNELKERQFTAIDLFKTIKDQPLLETFRVLMDERNIDYLKDLDGETLMKSISDEALQIELTERNLIGIPKSTWAYEQFILDELNNRPIETKKLLRQFKKPQTGLSHKNSCLKVIAMLTTYATDPRPELLDSILGQLAN